MQPAVLVTGGAGYVGSETVRVLLQAGFYPVVIDDLSTGFKEAVPDAVPFYLGDIKDYHFLNEIFLKYNISSVIHLAAKIVVEESFNDPIGYYDTNVNGLINLLRVCKKYLVKRIIFSSSGTVYGDANLTAGSNPKNQRLISEESSVGPLSPYGSSKLFGEKIIQDAAKSFGLDSICLRYFNVAGAALDGKNGQRRRQASHVVHVASQAAFKPEKEFIIYGNNYETIDGTCVRDYIHVEDIADIHVKAVQYLLDRRGENHVINCGYGRGYSVRQVVEAFSHVNQIHLKIKYGPRRLGDPAFLVCDASKLSELLLWKPRLADLSTICRTAFKWEINLKSSEK